MNYFFYFKNENELLINNNQFLETLNNSKKYFNEILKLSDILIEKVKNASEEIKNKPNKGSFSNCLFMAKAKVIKSDKPIVQSFLDSTSNYKWIEDEIYIEFIIGKIIRNNAVEFESKCGIIYTTKDLNNNEKLYHLTRKLNEELEEVFDELYKPLDFYTNEKNKEIKFDVDALCREFADLYDVINRINSLIIENK